MMSKTALILCAAVIVMLAAGATPARAQDVVGPAVAPAAPAATPDVAAAAPGCGLGLRLADRGAAVGGICPAAAPATLEPIFMVVKPRLRTCRCSCGYPCTTDADCGPGGVCGVGITCC